MSDILDKLDMVLQMMIDGNSYPCETCLGSGELPGTPVRCPRCENGTVVAKATDANVVAPMLGAAIVAMEPVFNRGDFGTLGLMLKWCVGYSQASQANAIRELSDRGISAETAIQSVLDRSKAGSDRRRAEEPKEPNVGAFTQEEIDAMMATDEVRDNKSHEEDCEDMGFQHDLTGTGTCRNCPLRKES